MCRRACKQCESTVGVKRIKIGYIFHPSFPEETSDNTLYSADLCSGCRNELRNAMLDFVKKWKEKALAVPCSAS